MYTYSASLGRGRSGVGRRARLIDLPYRTAVFEVPRATVDVRQARLPHPPSQTRYQVVIDVGDRNPPPGIEFRLLQSNGSLIGAEFTAVEDVEDLVTFTRARRPVVHEQPTSETIDPEFLTDLPPAGRRRRLPWLHIPTRQIPATAIRLPHKEHILAANEQRPRSQPRPAELRHHPSQPRKPRPRLHLRNKGAANALPRRPIRR